MTESRDETHDSIDPATGALTGEAVARRQGIMERLGVNTWAEALVHADLGDIPDAEPSTETQDVAAAEHVDETLPGSVQAASEAGFEAEVSAEAESDV